MGYKNRKGYIHKLAVLLIASSIFTIVDAACSPSATTPATPPAPQVATVVSIYACPTCGPVLVVGLQPTSLTKADYPYKVDLFEKGKLRQTDNITWYYQEWIDDRRVRGVKFDLTPEEYSYYLGRDVTDIFSVTVHE
jgi:hypothetical protein